MASCEKLSKCPFFNDKLGSMPATAAKMKQRYCSENRETCARYLVSAKGIPVPPDLFPNQHERAQGIIGQAG